MTATKYRLAAGDALGKFREHGPWSATETLLTSLLVGLHGVAERQGVDLLVAAERAKAIAEGLEE